MFELSELKAKKLIELQEIAKDLGLKKTTGLKKIELTYKIIDHQSTLPDPNEVSVAPTEEKSEAKTEEKPAQDAEKKRRFFKTETCPAQKAGTPGTKR